MDATQHEGTASRLDRLSVLRTDLERLLAQEVPVRDYASLSREYRAVLSEMDELAPADKKGDAVDEIAARRSARRPSAAQGATRTKRS